jgi:DNA-binding winged helix-turn-helix (wHTH) protein
MAVMGNCLTSPLSDSILQVRSKPGISGMGHQFEFGPFIFESNTGELRKGSQQLKVHGQATQILGILLARPGELNRSRGIPTAVMAGRHFSRCGS